MCRAVVNDTAITPYFGLNLSHMPSLVMKVTCLHVCAQAKVARSTEQMSMSMAVKLDRMWMFWNTLNMQGGEHSTDRPIFTLGCDHTKNQTLSVQCLNRSIGNNRE